MHLFIHYLFLVGIYVTTVSSFFLFSVKPLLELIIFMLTLSLIHSLAGFNTVLKLMWMIFHGLAAVRLIQHLLNTFPSSASIGLYHMTIFFVLRSFMSFLLSIIIQFQNINISASPDQSFSLIFFSIFFFF